jgi:1-aminocyclopropane-1-carboxylate deaminase/D-cysteine desulfhydrase-like pyridoxal-dependent ACC family enzyme
VVPEGGSGALKVLKGAQEMVEEKEPYELLVLPGGTGTTAAAIASKVKDPFTKVRCFQVLKGKNLAVERNCSTLESHPRRFTQFVDRRRISLWWIWKISSRS